MTFRANFDMQPNKSQKCLRGIVLLVTPPLSLQSLTFTCIDCPTDLLQLAGEDQARKETPQRMTR